MTQSETHEHTTSEIGRRRSSALEKGSTSYRERRREIARVAADLFNERGYSGTSMADVADALGSDRASLYYYIASKHELFDEVVREVVEVTVATARAVADGEAPALDKLCEVMIELMRSYDREYPLLYVYIRENLSHVDGARGEWSQEMRTFNQRYEDAVITIIQQGLDDGTIRPLATAQVLAYGVIGMIGWTNRWYVPGRTPAAADEIAQAYAEMAVAGLRA